MNKRQKVEIVVEKDKTDEDGYVLFPCTVENGSFFVDYDSIPKCFRMIMHLLRPWFHLRYTECDLDLLIEQRVWYSETDKIPQIPKPLPSWIDFPQRLCSSVAILTRDNEHKLRILLFRSDVGSEYLKLASSLLDCIDLEAAELAVSGYDSSFKRLEAAFSALEKAARRAVNNSTELLDEVLLNQAGSTKAGFHFLRLCPLFPHPYFRAYQDDKHCTLIAGAYLLYDNAGVFWKNRHRIQSDLPPKEAAKTPSEFKSCTEEQDVTFFGGVSSIRFMHVSGKHFDDTLAAIHPCYREIVNLAVRYVEGKDELFHFKKLLAEKEEEEEE